MTEQWRSLGNEINWPELENALDTFGPDHLSALPNFSIDRIRSLATHPNFHRCTGLYDAAVSEEGPETTALLAACGWLHRLKSAFVNFSPTAVPWSDLAALHLVRIDELVPKLVVALQSPIAHRDDDWPNGVGA